MNFLTTLGGVVAAAAGSGFALYGGQLFLRQRSILFRPSREMTADPASFGQAFENVFLKLQSGTSVHGWFIPRDQSEKLILFLPGSVGNLAYELSTLAFLLSFNASVLAIDYPGFGRSQGVPNERGCYAAADAAWHHAIYQKGISPENILLFGRCVGATVAAWLAARYKCAGLVCHSAFTSVPDWAATAYPVLPARYFCYIRFNTLKLIMNCHCPLLLMHSERDTRVPASHTATLYEKAHRPKMFLPLAGDHYGNDWQASPNLRTVFAAMLDGGGRSWN